MIPIGDGNIFVEPIYLQAETSRLPELVRVVVANGNQIAMEPTLELSLKVLFGEVRPTLPGETPTATPSTTPVATSTPDPAATPGAAATPTPVGTPADVGNVADLARQANAAFERGQAALRDNDFATYGREMAEVERLLPLIVDLSQ